MTAEVHGLAEVHEGINLSLEENPSVCSTTSSPPDFNGQCPTTLRGCDKKKERERKMG